MPRKDPKQVIVDPVAAAGQLEVKEPGEAFLGATPSPGLLQQAHENAASQCALGHGNPPGTRFCGECGLAMDAPAPVKADLQAARPKPAGELTEEERTERDRQHLEAIAAARRFEEQQAVYVPPEGETILIHFIEDGLTFAGQVWYRGQEIEIGPSHPRWAQAREWILLDDGGQMARYGKVFFRRGPWPGQRSYLAGAGGYQQLQTEDRKGRFAGPGEEALRQADAMEARRGRAVPAPIG